MNDAREDLLFQRALELTAGDAEWEELTRIARQDAAVWRRLARCLFDQAALQSAMDDVLSAADRAIPSPARPRRRQRWIGAAGWLAAAALLLFLALRDDPRPPPQALPDPKPADGGSLELVSSPVVSELPAVMIESVPAADGKSFDVILLRRTLERRHVDQMYRLAEDEHGNPLPVTLPWQPLNTERM